jgi:putative flavoprotein involved in K+ transport
VNLPVFEATGRPRHAQGVVNEAPGLFFVGLHFQSGLTSSLMGGVGDDAKFICDHI